MYQIETHKRISQIVTVFNLFDETSILRQKKWKFICLIFQMSFSLSLTIGGLSSDDKNEFVYLIASGIAVLVMSVKLNYILWKREKVLKFITDIGSHSVGELEEFMTINNKVEKLMKFSSGFILMIIFGVAALLTFYLPAFSSEIRLPFNIWLPVDWKNNVVVYWISYAFILISLALNVVFTLLGVIIWYLMMNCAIKYKILGNQFRNISSAKPTVKKRKITEAEKEKSFLQELISLIKTHQKIQETTDRFKSLFANFFFAQIRTSAICICSSVYVLAFNSHDGDLIQTMVNVAIMGYNSFDVFMVMYFGNEVKLSSDRLSYCLFESNWIDRSQSYKKCIIILTEILKKPHELVIGKLYPLNLETFNSIVNLAYSLFNILQNLN